MPQVPAFRFPPFSLSFVDFFSLFRPFFRVFCLSYSVRACVFIATTTRCCWWILCFLFLCPPPSVPSCPTACPQVRACMFPCVSPHTLLLSSLFLFFSVWVDIWFELFYFVFTLCNSIWPRALISGPASVAGTATGDARNTPAPQARKPPPEAIFVCDIPGVCTKICLRPSLEKACAMPWNVL